MKKKRKILGWGQFETPNELCIWVNGRINEGIKYEVVSITQDKFGLITLYYYIYQT